MSRPYAHGQIPEFVLRTDSFLPSADGVVDRIFRTSRMMPHDGVMQARMQTGAWLRAASGTPSPGALGVLMDVVLGGAAMQDRPTDSWAVTTHLSLHFARPLPTDGSFVRGEGRCLRVDALGAIAGGRAYYASGNILAEGNTWVQFTPGGPMADQDQHDLPRPPELPRSMPEVLGVIPSDDPASLSFPANDNLLNAHGTLHGDVVVALAEHAASRQLMSDGMELASLNTTFLRPGLGDLTLAVRQVHGGRSLQMYDVVVYDVAGRTCATSSAIYRWSTT
jgi:uncharacterized protein (TIGR00369 family)